MVRELQELVDDLARCHELYRCTGGAAGSAVAQVEGSLGQSLESISPCKDGEGQSLLKLLKDEADLRRLERLTTLASTGFSPRSLGAATARGIPIRIFSRPG